MGNTVGSMGSVDLRKGKLNNIEIFDCIAIFPYFFFYERDTDSLYNVSIVVSLSFPMIG